MQDLINRQAAIDIEGLDEEIRCEICRNPIRTNRGCDGNCTYDKKLYEKIMQMLDRRIKHVPSAQPEIIYCGECKHMMPNGKCRQFADSTIRPSASDFCSAGERKDNG